MLGQEDGERLLCTKGGSHFKQGHILGLVDSPWCVSRRWLYTVPNYEVAEVGAAFGA